MEGHILGIVFRRLQNNSTSSGTDSDDTQDFAETQGLLSTLWINVVIFATLMTFYEMNRHMKSIYLKRSTSKFKVERISPTDIPYPFHTLCCAKSQSLFSS